MVHFCLSYTNLDQKGIVPNTDLTRHTVSLSGGYTFNNKFSARAFVSYIKRKATTVLLSVMVQKVSCISSIAGCLLL